MPKSLEECVKRLKEEQGMEESKAFAICTAAQDKGVLNAMMDAKPLRMQDEGFEFSIDEETGFMHIKGVVARTGVQQYYGYEVGNEEAPMEVFNVHRPKEEVLHPDSLASFKNATITDDHPPEFVNVNNHIDFARGSMADVETFEKEGIDYIKTDIVINHQGLIDKIGDGKAELSVGYTQELKQRDGEFMGVKYDYVQTNIRVNHVAVVSQGRCGGQCRLSSDSKSVTIINEKDKQEENDVKITINGEEFDVPEAVAKEIEALQGKAADDAEELEKVEKEAEDAKKSIDTMQATIDGLKVDVKKAGADKMTDADIFALVTERADLVAVATASEVVVDEKMTCMDVKKAILEKETGDKFDEKSVEYIDARFDIMMDAKKAAQDSIDGLADDLKNKKTKLADDESGARDGRIKKNQDKFKQPGAK